MKRKLKLNRETLRNLEERDLEEVAGGNNSTVFTRCGSCQVSCASCVVSCGGTCQITCFVC
jgi:natural product precursor